MDFLSRKQPQTPEEHVALLPAGLRAVVERELAAGNRLGEAGSGFPAAPVGVWVKLAEPFKTALRPPPEGVVFRVRPNWMWPAEFTDTARHFFVTCVAGEIEARPPEPVRRGGSDPAAPKAQPMPAGQRFEAPRTSGLPNDLINRAIERHMGLWFTPESEAAITAEVGAEGMKLIREISDFANTPAFWTAGTNMSCYYAVQEKLRRQYPYLTEGAIVRVATSAAWGWK